MNTNEAIAPRGTPAPSKPPPAPGQPGPGTRIHHYELIRQLGSGGMGTVFLARDTRLGRRVAIKLLHTQDSQFTRRFLIEARATARCSHENIVIIHEVGEVGASPYMVLEFLQGQPLNRLLKGSPRLPPARAVELMVPVVRALACAHAQKIVHRDLKPENILVTDSGTIKVLDFGIAKVLQTDESHGETSPRAILAELYPRSVTGSREDAGNLTRQGALLGTLPYMSPEQWGNGVAIDHRTDIWAVGIMLFRMLAGRHPLEPLSGPQLMITGVLDEPMPRLRDVAPDTPVALAAVVDRCLLKHKEERFPDALSLLRALEPFLPGRYTRELRLDENPYAGLSSFQEADANRFFGRAKETAALVHRIQDRPLLAVVGPSGAGKSSFIRAGLMPVLKRSGEPWESFIIRPGRHPLAALASLVAPFVTSSPSVEEDIRKQQQLTDHLRSQPGYVGAVLRSRARRERRRILLFVDQFEELYTLVPDASERRAFTACLSGIADDATSPIRVVLSLRSDFLDRISEDERFMAELGQGLFFLGSPQREGLRDALVQPAELAGYRFETPAMVDQMLGHLEAAPGALPLLQFAATRLWEARDTPHRLLTESAYQKLGGITGALATHADGVLSGLSSQEHLLARAVFLRLVTPERTRAIVSLEELRELSREGEDVQRLVDQLVQARLLVIQTGAGSSGASVELVHESLILGWPTLLRWLEEGQEHAAFLDQLRNAARQWEAKSRDSGLLWRGEMVDEARRFQRRYRGELPQLQQAFLDAVFAGSARAARLRRAVLVGTTALLLLLVVAAAVALVVIGNARREAERQARLALHAEAAARTAESMARGAEAEAKQHLAEVQAKELERRQAQHQAETANAQVELTNLELFQKNDALRSALKRAQRAQLRARFAKVRAENSAAAAREAREEAELLLRREQERARRIEAALGSRFIELLK
ncbi:serine/threonine-protein kinase [Pyxidicoccus sp. MSG2]|uniref:serine/threonine-protein kinase n=1 Tax=Pyxidicoccus sp. MSG2 TaxID=2996790 RepID=UPI002270E2CA|nr:serine/threonine-protein kinase [Pyxidicoccus sp. MSG2]MCY1022179.1 protein kinase [Pyxidicoccus sp. MSG2]